MVYIPSGRLDVIKELNVVVVVVVLVVFIEQRLSGCTPSGQQILHSGSESNSSHKQSCLHVARLLHNRIGILGFDGSVQYLELQSPPSKQKAELLNSGSHSPFPQQSCGVDRQTFESIFPSS